VTEKDQNFLFVRLLKVLLILKILVPVPAEIPVLIDRVTHTTELPLEQLTQLVAGRYVVAGRLAGHVEVLSVLSVFGETLVLHGTKLWHAQAVDLVAKPMEEDS
jgi:hypothetical protein